MKSATAWLLVGALASPLMLGCGGKQKVETPVDLSGEPADLNAPTAESLAAMPCGNPDWSKPPAGSDPPE